MSTKKYYCYPIRDPSENHGWPTCLCGVPSETHRRPMGDRHVWTESHRIPICLIGDRQTSLETDKPNWGPAYLIGERHTSSETNMSHQRPIGRACSNMLVYDGFPIKHVSIRSGRLVSDQICWSPIKHVGL